MGKFTKANVLNQEIFGCNILKANPYIVDPTAERIWFSFTLKLLIDPGSFIIMTGESTFTFQK